MILRGARYAILARSANDHYWEQDRFPAWTALNTLRWFPGQRAGGGVEPHYHDCDELWLFTAGQGEVRLDGVPYPIGPNTAVYTPMGVVHEFHMTTDFANVPVVTPLEGQRRALHLHPEEHGAPVPTAAGFVVAGADNGGDFPDPGRRCPLTQLRLVELAAGAGFADVDPHRHEHWVVVDGAVGLEVDGVQAELHEGDIALLRAGCRRYLAARGPARVALARERIPPFEEIP